VSSPISAWKVGFIPEWIMREYLSRRGGVRFMPEDLEKAKSTLLGYSLNSLIIEGQSVPKRFLKPQLQAEIGDDTHTKGCKILDDYFKNELKQFLTDELDPLGREIIELFLNDGKLEDFEKLIPGEGIFIDD
jgi:hypothetical protein